MPLSACGASTKTAAGTSNSAGGPWQVSIDNPDTDTALFTLELNNAAYSTSSQTTAFVDINGKHYGHILNPKTGCPAQNRIAKTTDKAPPRHSIQ